MKTLFFLTLGLGLMSGGARAASAVAAPLQATLKEITGSVLVNQGEQFVELAPGTQLKPGDRVMSMEDSKALVRYFDDCEVEVKAGDVYTVDERLPCPCLNFKGEEDPVATLVESTGDLKLAPIRRVLRRHFGRADAAHRRPCADRERIQGPVRIPRRLPRRSRGIQRLRDPRPGRPACARPWCSTRWRRCRVRW